MAAEVWLRTNARAMWFGMALPASVALVGVLMLTAAPSRESLFWMRAAGGVLTGFGLLLVAALLLQLARPRLAFRDGELLVALRMGAPIRIPVEFVECFWLGQASSLLPGKRHRNTEAASLVIRIADSAGDWRRRSVEPKLGTWCDGYITIRGTWCEPLSIALVNRLNERLAEVTRRTTGQRTGKT